MSGIECYLCTSSIGSIQSPKGNLGESLGTCKSCHVFACGHHAQRDPNRPAYICAMCDRNLLAASAVSKAGVKSAVADMILASYFESALPPLRWRIESLKDFESRRPGYGEGFFSQIYNGETSISQRLGAEDPALLNLVLELDEESRMLVIAAALITIRLEINKAYTPDYLIKLTRSLTW